MIIENTSENKTFVFYMSRDGDAEDRAEVISILPQHFIYIDESKWTVKNLKRAMDDLKEIDADKVLVIKGDRKNYSIGSTPPKKEEFIDRTELIDLEE